MQNDVVMLKPNTLFSLIPSNPYPCIATISQAPTTTQTTTCDYHTRPINTSSKTLNLSLPNNTSTPLSNQTRNPATSTLRSPPVSSPTVTTINPKTIREHYNFPDYLICAYAEGEKDNSIIPYGEIEKTLCIAGAGWETKEDKNGQIYIYRNYLNNNAHIWLHFLSVNIMPSSHSSEFTPPQAHLLYQLIKQRPVRLHDVIFASIKEIAIYGRKGKNYPKEALSTEKVEKDLRITGGRPTRPFDFYIGTNWR
ncbi:hypothetical protein G2W53_027174 [Senna tora]|uniref:Putative plant transposon protein domain-containing protein n=1 Tax=Senna tora TaxID=362788 RepID=A0A834WM01_9FABA|nr:hypothetical protein G2W53_027174 [Senna tora]